MKQKEKGIQESEKPKIQETLIPNPMKGRPRMIAVQQTNWYWTGEECPQAESGFHATETGIKIPGKFSHMVKACASFAKRKNEKQGKLHPKYKAN